MKIFQRLFYLHLDLFEIKQKDQEISKYRQMLERFDKFDSKNKNSQNLLNHSNSVDLDERLSKKNQNEEENIKDNLANNNDYSKDKKLGSETEICKGCILF